MVQDAARFCPTGRVCEGFGRTNLRVQDCVTGSSVICRKFVILHYATLYCTILYCTVQLCCWYLFQQRHFPGAKFRCSFGLLVVGNKTHALQPSSRRELQQELSGAGHRGSVAVESPSNQGWSLKGRRHL